ncbi:hypothetical protein B0H14DRAFT_2600160 [Mycena olivaceomarginata]|nr:hypothetical protein B0H14DRAFT_2600160 [Mycena olivaceomarginata]
MTALYITGFNAAGGLQVLSFIVCAGIALQAKRQRSLGATRVHRKRPSSSIWRQFVFCGLHMAPGSYTFSQFIRRAPPLTLYPISCGYWLQRSVGPVTDLVYVLCPRLLDMAPPSASPSFFHLGSLRLVIADAEAHRETNAGRMSAEDSETIYMRSFLRVSGAARTNIRAFAVEPPGATGWLIRHAVPGGYVTWWLFGWRGKN